MQPKPPRSTAHRVTPFVTGLALLAAACSSGLGNLDDPADSPPNPNVSTGLFLMPEGKALPEPVTAHAAAGVALPTADPKQPREVVFYAFVTETDAAKIVDGAVEGNAGADVFLAAVEKNRIDPDAFSYSLAGKVRHPRCEVCHMMEDELTWAFRSEDGSYTVPDPPLYFPHAGGLVTGPTSTTDFTSPASCFIKPGDEVIRCHESIMDALNDELEDPDREPWLAPGTDIDARGESIPQLAQRVRESAVEHFRFNARVNWCMESADTPDVVNMGNTIVLVADNNHDGRDTPEDVDKRPRTVPGGAERLLDQVSRFSFLGNAPVDTRDAIRDVAVVSRSLMSPGQTANAASSSPSITFVPDEEFDWQKAGSQTAGLLHVAFASEASDLLAAGLNNNGVSDVYVSRFKVVVSTSGAGSVDLKFVDTVLVTNQDGSTFFGGDGASGDPDVSLDGSTVAFESAAADLAGIAGFNDRNGAGLDVFAWSRETATSLLASRAAGMGPLDGGDGDSRNPAVDGDGSAVAFDSDATDLITTDTNGHRDVFYATIDAGAISAVDRASVRNGGVEVTDPDGNAVSQNADILAEDGDIFITFESTFDDLDADVGDTGNVYHAGPNIGQEVQSEIYLHRVSDLRTVLVSRGVDETGARVLSNHDSRLPSFGARSTRVIYETEARNLDSEFVVKFAGDVVDIDENYFPDIVLSIATAALAGTGEVTTRGVSVSVDGEYGNGESTAPVAGAFRTYAGGGPASKEGFTCYLTRSTNLGGADMAFTEFQIPEGLPIPDPPLRYAAPTPIVVFQAPLGK